MRGMITRLICAACLLAAPAADARRARITAQDHRGNRIEPFRQIGHGETGRDRLRNCTEDRRWCAEWRRDRPDGLFTLHIVERPRGLFRRARRHAFPIPAEICCAVRGRGFSIWQEMVREARGGAIIGLDVSRATGERPGFFSYQRRLLLLRVPGEDGAVPVPVLEAPLSGVVEQPVCRSAEDLRDRRHACQDRFTLSTLYTLVPNVAPVKPPGLVMIATASTTPGRRSRAGGPVLRDPVERTDDDDWRDPACSFITIYTFDEAQGRYIPDEPLPACPDYLEP